MVFTVNGIQSYKEALKPKLELCQVSLEPVDDVTPPENATRGSSDLVKWKTLALTMGVCVVVLLGLQVAQFWRHFATYYQPQINDVEIDSPEGNELDDYLAPIRPNIITRAEWKGEERLEPPIRLELPVPFVVISHTGGDSCQTRMECSSNVRMVQMRDFEQNGFSDIGYNFLIGGDGNVYEGRGWDYVGAHTWTYNTRSVGISFVGNFSSVIPPDHQLIAAQQLMKLGVYKGKVASDYKLIGHRQNRASKTDSPGEVLYNIIKTWPHWVSVSATNRVV